MKANGYLVFEASEDFEQALSLDISADKPKGGVLDWRDVKDCAAIFETRQAARAAIARTEHYRLAFASNHPERKFCKIVPVNAA